MKRYQLPIVIEADEDGYVAFCPSLQGCCTQGGTYEEALENVKDAIRLHLEDRRETGEEIRPARSVSLSTIEVTL